MNRHTKNLQDWPIHLSLRGPSEHFSNTIPTENNVCSLKIQSMPAFQERNALHMDCNITGLGGLFPYIIQHEPFQAKHISMHVMVVHTLPQGCT